MKKRSLLLIVLVVPFSLFAQVPHERLVPLQSNPVIKKHLLLHPDAALKMSAPGDTLDIPFIDDFSDSHIYPDAARWTDNNVFINSDFARNPISIGVATFDGLDAEGNAYDNSSPTVQGGTDTLTSKPVYLLTKPASAGGGQYNLGDSITLSFYYQMKGWGDNPDSPDSLVVDFFNPTSGQWSRQWFARGPITGGRDTVFTSVQIRIRNTAFLQDGFRFRFRTYGSRTGSLDHWHVDYVRLYKAYNNFTNQMDTTLLDVAFTLPIRSYMSEYSTVPWDHFTSLSANDQQSLLVGNASMFYRVNGTSPSDVGFNNRIFDYAGNYVSGFGADNGNIFPNRPNNQPLIYSFAVDSIFPNSPAQTPDSTFFTISNYFSNSNAFSGLKSNDTVTYTQGFYNYYSLDDGTAEVGYDLINAPNGKLAMRFEILKPDTLRAVRFFFLQQAANVSNKLFSIRVWSSLNPETLIYSETNQRPVYIDQINGFATYVLDNIVPVSGTIYVGFQQVLADGLHLGFDRNTSSNSRMFYNVNGGWIPTAVANGTYMIRPVMGDTNLFVGTGELSKRNEFLLFPNPASAEVRIEIPSDMKARFTEVSDLSGRVIYSKPFERVLGINELGNGVYMVRITTAEGEMIQRKLIVSK